MQSPRITEATFSLLGGEGRHGRSRDRRRPGLRAQRHPPEQVVGAAGATKFAYTSDGKPYLTKKPKLILNDNNAGKPGGVHLMIGRRPYAAFGNSTGDRQMLGWTG